MSSFSWTQTAPPPGRRFGKRRDGRGEKRRQCSIGAVKRLLPLVLGAVGLTALLKRRREHEVEPWEPAPTATPADDLKAKLAESRGGEEAESAEPEPPVVEDPDADARRADVHARARQAMDELS